ncbi:hypothetical protein Mapa_010137 [Marchantia paleacea]|nr:hypothetical protein Mapa_010137 [Marchantia paleacea]
MNKRRVFSLLVFENLRINIIATKIQVRFTNHGFMTQKKRLQKVLRGFVVLVLFEITCQAL